MVASSGEVFDRTCWRRFAGFRARPWVITLRLALAWAVYWIQGVLSWAADRAGLRRDRRVRDFAETAKLQEVRVHSLYVDNIHAYALDPGIAESRLSLLVKEIRRLGLPVHEATRATNNFDSLGWAFRPGGFFFAKGDRGWKIGFAAEELE